MNKKKLMTLCMISDGDKILLGMKKRGFGVGRWNGFGGKVSADETIRDSAVRELQEEIGIQLTNFQKQALFHFEFEGDPVVLEVHVFNVKSYVGVPVESEEIAPAWFSRNDIPYDSMWPDDIFWLPQFLNGEFLKGYFKFNAATEIVETSLEELSAEQFADLFPEE